MLRAALALCLSLSACTPSLAGTWDLVALDGKTPTVDTVYEGCDVTASVTLQLDLDDGGDGAVTGDFTYARAGTWDCGGGESGETASQLTGAVDGDYEGDREWELDVDLDDGGAFDLVCELEGAALECEDEARRDYTLARR